jgi:hypothetical protein
MRYFVTLRGIGAAGILDAAQFCSLSGLNLNYVRKSYTTHFDPSGKKSGVGYGSYTPADQCDIFHKQYIFDIKERG